VTECDSRGRVSRLVGCPHLDDGFSRKKSISVAFFVPRDYK